MEYRVDVYGMKVITKYITEVTVEGSETTVCPGVASECKMEEVMTLASPNAVVDEESTAIRQR